MHLNIEDGFGGGGVGGRSKLQSTFDRKCNNHFNQSPDNYFFALMAQENTSHSTFSVTRET